MTAEGRAAVVQYMNHALNYAVSFWLNAALLMLLVTVV